MQRLCALGALSLLVALLFGCGGQSSSPVGNTLSTDGASRKTGVMQVTVNWPPYLPSANTSDSQDAATRSSRLIPANATYIVVTVQDGSPGTGTQQQILTRPVGTPTNLSTATLTLPLGTFPVDVKEYADNPPTASSIVLAEAQASIAITVSNTVSNPAALTISPHTDITSLTALATGPNAAKTKLIPGDQITIVATALNAANQVVPVPVGSVTYAFASGANTASLNSTTGVVTASQFGAASVQATLKLLKGDSSDPNNAVTFTSNPVSFTTDVQVSVSPNTQAVGVQSTPALANTAHFTASVAGDPNNSVTWSVRNASGNLAPTGGAIDASGNYTAPAQRGGGTYYVRATSTLNALQFGTATVTVQGGNISVNVN